MVADLSQSVCCGFKFSPNMNKVPTYLVLLFALATIVAKVDSVHFPLAKSLHEINPSLLIYSPVGPPMCSSVRATKYTTEQLAELISSHLAPKVPPRVVFIVHGFRDTGYVDWMHKMKNAMIKERNQTVVIVDWAEGAGANIPNYDYKQALVNIKPMGNWLAELIKELRIKNPSVYIWGIGHSIGAHLLGVAGRYNVPDFNRITGLDPAGPYLNRPGFDTSLILRRTDAPIVDVIHSDGCSSATESNCWVGPNNHYATMTPLGIIDFYPNYGVFMPDVDPLDIGKPHRRAIDLFLISIEHKGLFRTRTYLYGRPGPGVTSIPSRDSSKYAEMGYFADRSFIPTKPTDESFFTIDRETLQKAERYRDISFSRQTRDAKPNGIGTAIECYGLPSKSGVFSPSLLNLVLFVLIAVFVIQRW